MMDSIKNLPVLCPSCGKKLNVHALDCPHCATHIEGEYRLPAFMLLPADEQRFILDSVKCGGSLKEMAAQLGLSYPTVRNRLDDLIEHLKMLKL